MYNLVTLPTGNGFVNLDNLTPKSDPAHIILTLLCFSLKNFNSDINSSQTWISSINKILSSLSKSKSNINFKLFYFVSDESSDLY